MGDDFKFWAGYLLLFPLWLVFIWLVAGVAKFMWAMTACM